MKEPREFPELAGALAELAEKDAGIAPPPDLQQRVMAKAASPAVTTRRYFGAWIGAAAVVLIASAVLFQQRPQPRADARPFVSLPFVAPPAPYERTAVVRQTVPIAALIAAGFEVHVVDSGGALPAEVLVGQDGRALAIRLVTGSADKSKRRFDE